LKLELLELLLGRDETFFELILLSKERCVLGTKTLVLGVGCVVLTTASL